MGNTVKYKIKDSVFTNLFREKKYVLQLYKALFPGDGGVTEDDITIITLENVMINAIYNDLGFMVNGRLIVLVEAQSTWSVNILVRLFLYLAREYKEYIDKNEIDLYSSKKISIPKPELYVIYTGDKKSDRDIISLADEFFGGEKVVDLNIKVITTGKNNDIIYQYVAFTQVLNERIKIYGRTERAVIETIRLCKDKNILREYLSEREKEVIDMMQTLFDMDHLMDVHDKNCYKEGQNDLLIALREMGADEAMLQKAVEQTRQAADRG